MLIKMFSWIITITSYISQKLSSRNFYLSHVELVFILSYLLSQLINLVSLSSQLSPSFIFSSLGQVTLKCKFELNFIVQPNKRDSISMCNIELNELGLGIIKHNNLDTVFNGLSQDTSTYVKLSVESLILNL